MRELVSRSETKMPRLSTLRTRPLACSSSSDSRTTLWATPKRLARCCWVRRVPGLSSPERISLRTSSRTRPRAVVCVPPPAPPAPPAPLPFPFPPFAISVVIAFAPVRTQLLNQHRGKHFYEDRAHAADQQGRGEADTKRFPAEVLEFG